MAVDPSNQSSENPLSLQRLKAAFARMVAPRDQTAEAPTSDNQTPDSPLGNGLPGNDPTADDAVNLHAILEAVLFVGGDGGRPRSAEELAEALRDVTPQEVAQATDELNARYQQDGAPMHIESSPAGYRLCLDEDLGRLRDKFNGRVREARLTPAALEVLSVVAYRQPISAAEIDKLRESRSGSQLANLVRRQLLRIDREGTSETHYRTTDRFLKLFRLSDLDQLPRAAELE